MVNPISMRKESINYKYKHTFNSFKFFLVGNEEITNIR